MEKTKFNTFLYIMAVYIFISYVLGPVAFYYLMDKTLVSAGNGFIAGSILSIILWLVVGCKMVK
jgi:pilus assembly protein TadC